MENFIGEIRLFAGPYVPDGWHACDGSTLAIRDYDALYSLIGAVYGGDGITNFALPDLRGRVPVGLGWGPGLQTNYALGQKVGAETVALQAAHQPAHTHTVAASTATADDTTAGGYFAVPAGVAKAYAPLGSAQPVSLSQQAMTVDGGSAPHQNMQPFLVVTYIIALNGTYPARP